MQVMMEDSPPILRFENTAEVDRVATEQAGGKLQYMDVVKVFVQARGDMKTSVPYIARKTHWEITETEVVSEKEFTSLQEVDGEMQEVTTKQPVKEMKKLYSKSIVTPWLDNLAKRHRDRRISDRYFEYCKESFDRFMKNQDMPVQGTPLKDWAGAHERVKKRAIECGINSVELAAEMTEQAIQEIGMGARDMKKAAQAYLERDRDPEKFARRLVSLEEESQEKDQTISSLQEKLRELEAAAQKGKPGRKPKAEQEEAA